MKALLCASALLLAMGAAAVTKAAPAQNPAGERAFMKCYSCHSVEPDENVSGPTLHQVVGRRVAAVPGFTYSPALRAFAQKHPRWTRELLLRFAADPEKLVPGTTMVFHGIPDPKERAALVGYLESDRR